MKGRTLAVLGLIVLIFSIIGQPAFRPPLVAGSGRTPGPTGFEPAPERTGFAQESSRLFLPLINHRARSVVPTPYGITMYGAVDEAAGLGKLAEAGSSWLVTVLDWSRTEPVKGQYNWGELDAKVRNAQTAGFEVFVLLVNNPPWASANPNGPVNNVRDLVDFVAAAARRYNCEVPGKPCIRYWSFYPEPDHKDRFGNNPQAMAEIMAAVGPAIRGVMPSAKVLIGGLAYDWFTDDGPPFPRPGSFVQSFLPNTLAALNNIGGGPGQARKFIDAVAFHYYPIAEFRWPTIREKALEIKGIMAAAGLADLPVYVPEMGFWSSPRANSSEDYQARRLVEMFVLGQAAGVFKLAWFEVFDVRQGDPEEHGLFWGTDLSRPKKAYWAYKTLTAQLTGYAYSGALSTGQVEAHVFRSASGREKTVVWSQPKDTPGTFTLPGTCLRVVDTTGQVSLLTGSGQVTLTLPANEVLFVEACS
ncbi:MAG: hypothetical protein C4316_09800 [Chloroflexota bacterium]